MARVPITVMGFRCERCSHEWIPRDMEQEPKTCPKCRSPYWDRPRKGPPMTYEEFRDAIVAQIRASDRPLTWTEIRTAAKLPQMLPNNQWVRRMEADSHLLRKKDGRGIIHWTLSQD